MTSAPVDDLLAETLQREMGLRVQSEDAQSVRQWIAERVRVLSLSDHEAYLQRLAEASMRGRTERQLISGLLTAGESYFFRDAAQIDLLEFAILPELIARRSDRRSLRVWSAGCATGEEAYTLAMLLEELVPADAGWAIEIVATDIRTYALDRARRGLYTDHSFRRIGAGRKDRYFSRNDALWEVDARLRERISFRTVDLVRENFPRTESGLAAFDLILCRDVFSYLSDDAVRSVIRKLAASLNGDGYLMTGFGERVVQAPELLRMRWYPQSTVYHRSADGASIAHSATLGESRCDQIVASAWDHAVRGRVDVAAQICLEAMVACPPDARPYCLLGHLAVQRGDLTKAKTLLQKAASLEPTYAPAYLALAAVHRAESDYWGQRRMYHAARAALLTMTDAESIAPFETVTPSQILAFVERMLKAEA